MKKLDLHGVRHIDVRPTVIRYVEDHWNSGEEAIIVTGHSIKMRALVIEILDEYKLNHEKKVGCITALME
jgi:hypothetical protein